MNFLKVIWNIDPEKFHIGGFGLRHYSLMFVWVFLIGYDLMSRIFIKAKGDKTFLQKLQIYEMPGTIISARPGQILLYEFDYYNRILNHFENNTNQTNYKIIN